MLGRLVGGLAHEIRNPLGAIINATAILERAIVPASTDATRALGIIHEEGWRANRIIVDLIDYARVRPPEPKPLSVDQRISQVLVGEDIPDAIAVEREVPAGLTALADKEQTEAALRKVVRNVVEAMLAGRTLTLAAQRSGAQILLWVTDSGPGISAAVRAHLFDPLVTTKSLGLGLGLSTARALVEAQRGTLTVTAPEAGGARFELRLPVFTG